MNIAVCTLFEGNYHIGVAALANSLHASGFRGTLWAGHRGLRPPWAAGASSVSISENFRVVFVSVQTQEHLTNFKPAFLQQVLGTFAPDADAVAYFDPDIVVKCRWESVFPHWLDGGIALVEDVNASMPARHPQRLAWTRWLSAHNFAPAPASAPASARALDRYYNAGFVGVPRAHLAFLSLWENILKLARDDGSADTGRLKNGDATNLFHSADQDALNIALMLAADTPINAAGPDAMDFTAGGHHLSHAAGVPKPWQGGHFVRALRGYPPSQAAKNFLRHTERPIAIFSAAQRRHRRAVIALAAFVGRFYRRT